MVTFVVEISLAGRTIFKRFFGKQKLFKDLILQKHFKF